MGSAAAHSNLYCRGWQDSSAFGESELLQLFAPFGEIASLRLVTGGDSQSAAPHAFVKYARPDQAAAAIQGLNGTPIAGGQLVVKFADADVQPRVESGRQPSEWCYCRNLPAAYTRQDVGELFLPFGTVLEIRLFPSTELYKGSGALVQMQSMEQAAAAINTLNGSFPRGATQPLLVRYADSPAEKAAKQARKERLLTKQAAPAAMFGGSNLLAAQLQQQLLGLAIGSSGQAQLGGSPDLPPGDLASPLLHAMDGYQGDGMLPQAAVLQQQSGLGGGGSGAGGGTGASIYIKGMPEDADKLWLYEKFARFGGISSVRVLVDEQSGKCNGIGFVNYVAANAALLAQEAMNGVSMGDRLLHVMVQNPAARSRTAPLGAATGMGTLPSPLVSPMGGAGLGAQRAPMQPVSQPSGLALNASTLATLQAAARAGLMPSATNGMTLQPNGLSLQLGGQGYGGPNQHEGFANLAQW